MELHMFTSPIERWVRRFHANVQWTSKKMQHALESMMHVQSCYFAHKTNYQLLLLLSLSLWLIKLQIIFSRKRSPGIHCNY